MATGTRLGDVSAVTVRSVVALAAPSTAFTVLRHSYRSVDQYFIKAVSTEAQAAIGAALFVLIVFAGAFEIIAAGASPLVARATGAGDVGARRRSLGAATAGALLLALLTALVGGLGAGWIAGLLGLSGQTAVEAERYLFWISVTALPLVFTPLVDQAFVAMGRARLPMVLHAVSLGLNLILTPLFIVEFGWGIMGAALASNLSRGVATGVGFVFLWRGVGAQSGDLSLGPELGRLVRVGLPMGLGTILYALVYWAMLATSISPLGPEVNAALGIGFSALEGFTWPCFHGVALAVSSFVGRALGAGRPEDAHRAMQIAFPIVTVMGLLAAGAFFFGGRFLTGLFAADAIVHDKATEYAMILAASQLFVAWESLAEGVLAGAGDTRTVFWWSVPANIVRVPLAWAFAFPLGLGAAGVWWAINLTTVFKALTKGWWAVRGGWAELEI